MLKNEGLVNAGQVRNLVKASLSLKYCTVIRPNPALAHWWSV